jgi:hypothetical protein
MEFSVLYYGILRVSALRQGCRAPIRAKTYEYSYIFYLQLFRNFFDFFPTPKMVSFSIISFIFIGLHLPMQIAAENRYIRAYRYYPDAAVLQPRQSTFVGGWALRAIQCPSDSTRCEMTRGVPTCCPKNTVCVKEGYKNMPVCCAEGISIDSTGFMALN